VCQPFHNKLIGIIIFFVWLTTHRRHRWTAYWQLTRSNGQDIVQTTTHRFQKTFLTSWGSKQILSILLCVGQIKSVRQLLLSILEQTSLNTTLNNEPHWNLLWTTFTDHNLFVFVLNYIFIWIGTISFFVRFASMTSGSEKRYINLTYIPSSLT